MSAKIIIGIGGLLLSVLTYFAGVVRTERRYKSQAKEKRIDDFVNTLFSKYKGAGVVIELLVPSGIHNLRNDAEIKTALETVGNRLGYHPLRSWNDDVESIGYKEFFTFILKNKIQLNTKSIVSAINNIGKHD